MDRRVKERLVGAAILVGVLVAVAPELLSGRKPSAPAAAAAAQGPIRTYTVDFAETTGPSQARETSTAAAGAGADAVAAPPAATSSGAGAEATGGESAAAGTAAATGAVAGLVTRSARPGGAEESGGAAPEAAAPDAAAAANGANGGKGHGSWYVQTGSFATQANAQKLSRDLRAQGFVVLVSAVGTGKSLRHRVRVGPFADRDAATQAADKLKAQGHSAGLVPPT
jgi:DedD protein